MKKPIVRTAALAMSAIMLFGMAACGTTAPVESASEPSVAATSAEASSEASASGEESAPPAAPSPVTLKVAAFTAAAEPNGVRTDPVSVQIQKDTGVTMDLTSVSEADWTQQFNALLAANDLPDIFLIPEGKKSVDMMVNGGQIAALDDLLVDHAPNLMTDPLGKAMVALHKQTMSPDGKLYTIGMCRGTWDNGTQPLVGDFLRWDLYAQLGYPKLETFDEDLLNVLAEMQKLEPKNKDGKKVYALGGWFGDGQGWGDWTFTYRMTFAEGTGFLTQDRMITADIGSKAPSDVNALKDKNSTFWRYTKFMNKANQMGLLDPESFTQKWDKYVEKINTGRYLYFNPGWLTGDANKYFTTNNMPEKGYTALPPLSTDKFMLVSMMYAGERTYGVSANCAAPERAMDLLDYLSTYKASRMVNNGLEGTNWTMENGKPTPTDDFLNVTADNEFMKKTGAGVLHHFMGYAGGTIEPETNVAIGLNYASDKAMAKGLLPVHKDMLGHFGATGLYELYTTKSQYYKGDLMYNLGDLPDDLKTLDTSLIAYEFKETFNCVMAESDADFAAKQDAFIAGLDKYKADQIFAYWLAKAQEQQTSLQPIYDMLK